MKDFSALFGLVRQGIVNTNVLNRFADALVTGVAGSPPMSPVEHAMNNMSSWLSHRMHTLAIEQKFARLVLVCDFINFRAGKGVRIRVRIDNELYFDETATQQLDDDKENQGADGGRASKSPGKAKPAGRVSIVLQDERLTIDPNNDAKEVPDALLDYSYHQLPVAQAVWKSMHGYEVEQGSAPLFGSFIAVPSSTAPASPSWVSGGYRLRPDAWLEVSGLPSSASVWSVAAVFADYTVKNVYFTQSRTKAYQAQGVDANGGVGADCHSSPATFAADRARVSVEPLGGGARAGRGARSAVEVPRALPAHHLGHPRPHARGEQLGRLLQRRHAHAHAVRRSRQVRQGDQGAQVIAGVITSVVLLLANERHAAVSVVVPL